MNTSESPGSRTQTRVLAGLVGLLGLVAAAIVGSGIRGAVLADPYTPDPAAMLPLAVLTVLLAPLFAALWNRATLHPRLVQAGLWAFTALATVLAVLVVASLLDAVALQGNPDTVGGPPESGSYRVGAGQYALTLAVVSYSLLAAVLAVLESRRLRAWEAVKGSRRPLAAYTGMTLGIVLASALSTLV